MEKLEAEFTVLLEALYINCCLCSGVPFRDIPFENKFGLYFNFSHVAISPTSSNCPFFLILENSVHATNSPEGQSWHTLSYANLTKDFGGQQNKGVS